MRGSLRPVRSRGSPVPLWPAVSAVAPGGDVVPPWPWLLLVSRALPGLLWSVVASLAAALLVCAAIVQPLAADVNTLRYVCAQVCSGGFLLGCSVHPCACCCHCWRCSVLCVCSGTASFAHTVSYRCWCSGCYCLALLICCCCICPLLVAA